MKRLRNGPIGLTLLLVLALVSVPAAFAFEIEAHGPVSGSTVGCACSGLAGSGDAGAPLLAALAEGSSTVLASAESSLSGDDAYDEAAGGTPWLSSAGGDAYAFSWEDVYGEAGAPWLVAAAEGSSLLASAESSLSGDDAYDEAAGGAPWLSVASFGLLADSSLGSDSILTCSLSADEVAARGTWSVEGGLSGDDAYDAAAGGTPELSLLVFADDAALVAACESDIAGS
jgi:hypothetical protein